MLYAPFSHFVYLVEGISGFDLDMDHLVSPATYATWRRVDQLIPDSSTMIGTIGPGPKDGCAFWQLNPGMDPLVGFDKWVKTNATYFSKNHSRRYEHSEYYRVFKVV